MPEVARACRPRDARNVVQRCGTTTPPSDPRRRGAAAGGLPDGALMRRAAYGLAAAIARELVARTGGVAGPAGVRGRRLRRQRRRRAVGGDLAAPPRRGGRRGPAQPRARPRQGLAAFGSAGGRIVETVPAATDLVIDGVVGISGPGPLRPAPPRCSPTSTTRASRWWPSTSPAASTRTPARATARRARRADRHLRRPQTGSRAGDCGRVELVDIGLDLPADRHARLRRRRRRARAGRCPGRSDDKYTQGVTGVMAGSATYPGAADPVHRRRRRRHLRHGPLRGKRCRRSGFALARGGRGAERGAAGPGAGLGGRPGPGHRRSGGCGAVVRLAPTCR